MITTGNHLAVVKQASKSYHTSAKKVDATQNISLE